MTSVCAASASSCLVVLASLASAAGVAAQNHTRAAEPIALAPGLVSRTWAGASLVRAPRCLDADHRGRLWVLDRDDRGGCILVLEDRDGDGAADEASTFRADPRFAEAEGLLVLDATPYVGLGETLLAVHAGREELVLTLSGRRIRGCAFGPDGWLYVAVGRGPACAIRGRRWHGGMIVRARPDGKDLHVYAHNLCDPVDVAVDANGDVWVCDADDGAGCSRTLWVLEGGDGGYFARDGRTWQNDRLFWQTTAQAHWHQDDPGVLPMGRLLASGQPTGLAIADSPFLPEALDGAVLTAASGTIAADVPAPSRAGMVLEPGWLARGAGGALQARDVALGLDGAIYVADGDRILRLAHPAAPLGAPPGDLTTVAGLLRAMAVPAANVRSLALARLRERDVPDPWEGLDLERVTRREITRRALAWTWAAPPTDRHGRPAREGTAVLRSRRCFESGPAFAEWVEEERTRPPLGSRYFMLERLERREFLLAAPHALDVLGELAPRVDAADRFEVATFRRAVGARADALYPQILEALGRDRGDQPSTWTPELSGLVRALHPKPAVPALLQRALGVRLGQDRQFEAIDTLAFVDDVAAVDALLRVAAETGGELRERARAWLRRNRDGAWSRWRDRIPPD